jgi:hypothetical protein
MFFTPVVLENIFDEEDVAALHSMIAAGVKDPLFDARNSRDLKRYKKLENYFSKKLEPLAVEVFGDETLKTSYSVYIDYNKPESGLVMHRDQNACVYTIDYCLSAKTPWGVVVEGEEFVFGTGQALAFMGGEDLHGRNAMPDPKGNRVQVIMFHFVPDGHWFFTEGPDYIETLISEGRITEY